MADLAKKILESIKAGLGLIGKYLLMVIIIVRNFITRKRRLYANPVFYIALIGAFCAGVYLRQPAQNIMSKNSKSKEKTQVAKVVETDFYTGWEKYEDQLGYTIRYPKDWQFKKEDELSRSLCKDEYCLYFAMNKQGSGELKIFQRYDKEKPTDSGYLKIGEEKLKKQKYLVGEKAKEYYYPKTVQNVKNFQIIASFAYKNKKVEEASVDMETLDSRAIAEKILQSIELK